MTTTPKAPTVRLEHITPAVADKYLGTQLHNRVLRDSRVDHWIAVIERGEWLLSNDAVAFDTGGHLINGQHRLTALVVVGKPLPFIVARNLPTKTQDIMDSGLARATGDALKLRGEVSVTATAAALRWEHKMRWIEKDPEAAISAITNKLPASTPMLLGIFDEDPETWREAVKRVQTYMHQVRMRPGPTSMLWRRFHRLDADDCDAFFEALTSGAGLGEGSPILQLRNQLVKTNARGMNRMVDFREVALMIKAWNLWREGEERGTLKWNYGALNREDFPLPR